LLRVEVKAGHGLGKPTAKVIDEQTDIYAFLLHTLRVGLSPEPASSHPSCAQPR
jgi:prolyl oligopeptidase